MATIVSSRMEQLQIFSFAFHGKITLFRAVNVSFKGAVQEIKYKNALISIFKIDFHQFLGSGQQY